ncbi:hypothetical protein ABW19_dt0206526 [Dactylella cylindrospora]|nr:hypothetical protein ABW19_dt0206526 [Dactylella cylindrospora]
MSNAANASSNPFSPSDPFSRLLNSTGINIDNYPSAASNPLLSKPIPPEVVNSWPLPNYVNPETKHAQMFGWELGLVSLAVVTVALRLYVRLWMMRPLWGVGGDDWAAAVAVLAFSTQILFVLCTTATKLSILWFYLRLSASPTFRLLVHLGMFFVSATGISFLFVIIFQCSPINSYWDLTLPKAKCIDESAANIANAVINSFSDFYVFMLPVRDMLGLRLPLRQRLPTSSQAVNGEDPAGIKKV